MTDFDRLIDRKGTGSIKWEKYAAQTDKQGREIIPLWVADSDFKTCPAVIDALQQRAAQGVFGYTLQPMPSLADAIVNHLKVRYGWTIQTDWIVLLPSLVSGLNLACHTAGKAGDAVISPETIYPPFKSACKNAQRELITVPIKERDRRWVLDFDQLETCVTPTTRMLLLCNPHNPGGTVYSRRELQRIHALCEKQDLLICSDEIHCDLILDQDRQHIPLATLNKDANRRTITLMAASKTFNIAGLSCGFAIVADAGLRQRFRRAGQGLIPEINLLGQVATEAAFTHGSDWLEQQNNYLRQNRDYLYDAINAIPGLVMHKPEATFLAWIDVSALELEDPPGFFEQAGVGMSPGKAFGDERFMRLNFACPRERLKEAVDRIHRAVDYYAK